MPASRRKPPAKKRPARPRVAHRSAGTPIRRGIRWDRLPGNWLVAIVLIMAVLYLPPLHSYWNQRKETTAAKAQLQQLGKENRGLKARARSLKRNSTIEREARKLGMVKADERPYVILR
ncbi:MAG: FtsB family cell division protein [Solirubrobacterales bacterium]